MYSVITLEVLDQISRNCPKAMSIYALCLGHANEFGECAFSKEDIQKTLHESVTKFRNGLIALAREGLLEWHNIDGKIHIQLANTDDD